MNEKIGQYQINWNTTQFLGTEIKTPVNGITFVAKRRYPSHSRRLAPFFKVDKSEGGDQQPALIPIYRLGFRRAWRAALIELGKGREGQELVRFMRRAPPIESFVRTN